MMLQFIYREGLVYEDGKIWESTGLNGQSKLVLLDAKTSKVLAESQLDGEYFGTYVLLCGSPLAKQTLLSLA